MSDNSNIPSIPIEPGIDPGLEMILNPPLQTEFNSQPPLVKPSVESPLSSPQPTEPKTESTLSPPPLNKLNQESIFSSPLVTDPKPESTFVTTPLPDLAQLKQEKIEEKLTTSSNIIPSNIVMGAGLPGDIDEISPDANDSKFDPEKPYQGNRFVFTVISIQVILFIAMISVTICNGIFHQINWPFPTVEQLASYNFVGVTPQNPDASSASVLIEAIMWGLAGVLARLEYSLTQIVVERHKIEILEIVSNTIGDIAMGVSITVVVIALLRAVEFNVSDINVSLKTANIESIIAISFMLGFYHENTRKILGVFQRKITNIGPNNPNSPGNSGQPGA